MNRESPDHRASQGERSGRAPPATSHHDLVFTPNLASLVTGVPTQRLLEWERTGLLPRRRLGSRRRRRYSIRDLKTVDALQKALDEELAERTLELRATDRAKSDFMRLVAHELRAPMAIANGYVSMIRDGSFGPVPAPIREALPIVEAKLQEMGRLVQQMLEVARVEDGRILLKKEALDLRSVLGRAVKGATLPARPQHEIKVSVPDHEIRVHGDRSRLLTILSNLISNAIKYSPEGGVLDISARTDASWASVTVRDEGIGISERDLPRLFSRFGRVESEQTQAISGTGLGLYLSRELAQRHGGDITVESVEGSGSAFTLKIPYDPMAGLAG